MVRGQRIKPALIAGVIAAGMAATPAAADDFYHGRTITIAVAASASGTYSLYARVMARYWPKHIPGEPTIITQYYAGSGGLKGSNYVSNAAPKDGTTVGMPLPTIPMRQFLEPKGVKYDVAKWRWIGNLAVIPGTLGVWHTAGVATVAEAKRKQVIIGGTALGSTTTTYPLLLNRTLGTRFKMVLGYTGTPAMDHAMESGEIQGRTGTWTSWRDRHPQWITGGMVHILMQVDARRAPDLPNVPRLIDLAENDQQRKMFEYVTYSTLLGAALYAPPGVPADRIKLLRDGFDAVVKDPAFIAEVKAQKLDFEPMDWREVEDAIRRTVSVEPSVVEALKAAFVN